MVTSRYEYLTLDRHGTMPGEIVDPAEEGAGRFFAKDHEQYIN
ncbi:hypothetical protein [Populibacterium corticicola]